MPVLNFFRNLLGGRDREELRNERLDDPQSRTHSFRNPIWQNDDENNDDDFRHFGNGMHFSIFTDPVEITRYFETQMDEILKSFFPGLDSSIFFSIPGSENVPKVPFAEPSQDNLRDKMLKPGYDIPIYHDSNKSKIDADLDGKISPEDLTKIWDEPDDSKKQIVPFTKQFHQSSRFVTKKFIRGPNGTIEEQQTIRDSEGNEETIVSKQIGDKKYVVTTKKDKNGVETKTEDLINIDLSEITNFEQNWKSPSESNHNHSSILNYFPWEKFFEPNPKL